MPEDPHEPPLPPPGPAAPAEVPVAGKKRRWGGMLLKIFAGLLLVFVIFHRPVLQWTLTTLLYKVAARQNVSLELDISGSMLWNLTVQNVRALPTGEGESPVRKITIEYLHFEYSIPKLITGGLGEFLKSYEIRHADIDIVAKPSKNEAEKRQKRTLADDLNNLLAQPALYADEVGVEDFNLVVQSPKDVTRVEGLHLFLHPQKQGWLRVEAIELPKLPAWRKLSATTSYANRNLVITGLELDPRIKIDRFRFDASRRAEDRGSLGLDARLFGGTLALELEGKQLPQKGENLKKSYDTELRVTASRINIASAVDYFARKEIPPTRLLDLKIDVRGQPERPSTWTGGVALGVGTAALGETALDRVFAEAEVKDGLAKITKAGVAIGENTVAITGEARLPDSVNRLGETDLQVEMKINAPDLREATMGFLPGRPVRGQLVGDGTLTLKEQQMSTKLALRAENIAQAQFAVESAEIAAAVSRPLKNTPGTPLDRVSGTIAAKVGEMRVGNYRADSAELNASLAENLLSVAKLAVISGENSITGSGELAFPEGKSIPRPVAAKFAIKVPELAAVGVSINEDVLAGQIEGEGALQTVNGKLTGTVDLTGATIRHGDFRARSFAAKLAIDAEEKSSLALEAEAIGTSDVYVEAAKVAVASSNVIERTRVGGWHELDANVDAVLTAPRYKNFNLDSADFDIQTAAGVLKVSRLDVQRAENSVTASASFQLLEGKAVPRPIEAQFAVDVPDLATLGIESNREVLDGRIQGKGSLFSAGGRLNGSAELQVEGVRVEEFRIGELAANLRIDQNENVRVVANVGELESAAFNIPKADTTLTSDNLVRILHDGQWDRLNADASASITAPRIRTYTADRAAFEGNVRSGLLTVKELAVTRGENRAVVEGTFQFPADKPVPQPVHATFAITAPELAAFAVEANTETLAGRANANGTVRVVNGRYAGELRLRASDLAVNELRAGELSGNVTIDDAEALKADLDFAAIAMKDFAIKEGGLKLNSTDLLQRLRDTNPRQATAELSAALAGVRYRTYSAETVGLKASSEAGLVHVQELKLASGSNTAVLEGSFQLPKAGAPELVDANVRADIPDLSAFEVTLNRNLLDGRIEGEASIRRLDGQLNGTIAMTGANLVVGEFKAGEIVADGKVDQSETSTLTVRTKEISSPDLAIRTGSVTATADRLLERTRGGLFENLDADVSAAFAGLRYKTFTADEAELSGAVSDRVVTVEEMRIAKDENLLTADGSVRIPGEGAAPVPIKANYTVAIPDLAAFGLRVKEAELGGELRGKGAMETADGELTGAAEIAGESLRLGKADLGELRGKLTAAENEITIEEVRLRIKEGVELAATGKLGIAEGQPYEGAFLAVADNLAKLQPLLAVLGIDKEVSGALDLSVESAGQLRPQRHDGQVKLAVDGARYGEIDLSKVRLDGLFGPEFAETSAFEVVSGPTHLKAGLSWREKKLAARDIELQQGTQQVLSGFISVPFEPGNKEGLIPMDQRIAANVNARELKIAPLLKTFGKPSPVDGTLSANVVAGGTIFRPTFHLKVTGRGITSTAAPKVRPAEIDLVSDYVDRELTLNLAVKQPQIETLTVRGSMPLNLEGTLQQKKLDPDLPLDLTVSLPQTSLAIVADLVPAIRSIEGSTAINARVSGTVRKPA
ncbi:MAG: hypothetical protein ACO1QR_02830, partial [Chthoniobacteraceae bacterium]